MKTKIIASSKNSFIISSGLLLKALKEMKYTINKNCVLPILEDVQFKIHAEKDKSFVELTATDLENSAIRFVECEASTDFQFCVPYVQSVKFISSLTEQPLIFSFDEKTMQVQICADEIMCSMSTEKGDDFPRIPKLENLKFKLNVTDEIATAIHTALPFVGTDETRANMTGVCIQFMEGNKVNVISTDAHSLFLAEFDAPVTEIGEIIIPAKLASQISPGILVSNGLNVWHTRNNKQGYAMNDISRCISEKAFPNYAAVIPESGTSLKFNREAMIKALKQIEPFASKATHQIVLSLNGAIQMSATDKDFAQEVTKVIKGDWQGEVMDISFNASLLIKMLNEYRNETVSAEFSTPSRAVTFKEDNKTFLLMPIMIAA